MIDFALDSTGDLSIVNGDIAKVSGGDAIRQVLQIAVGWIKGEWKVNLEPGFDYVGLFEGDAVSETKLAAAVRAYILAQPGILRVNKCDLTMDRTARRVSVDAEATYDTGEVIPIRKVISLPDFLEAP